MRTGWVVLACLLLLAPTTAQNGTENGTADGTTDAPVGDGNTTDDPLPDRDPLFGRSAVTAGAWIGVTLVVAVAAFLYGRRT